MKSLFTILFFSASTLASAQESTLPYREIPAYPETFTAGSVASRVIDGLGFRFYWATDGLRPEDLNFKPGKEARSSEETIEHIYGMSILIRNSVTHTVNVAGQDKRLPFAEMRKLTLQNLKAASDILRVCKEEEMKGFTLQFRKPDGSLSEYPFWNQLNGPIEDCVWHVGQVVSFRRSSGNPFTDKVSVFTGTVNK
jgi:hypothetical protein